MGVRVRKLARELDTSPGHVLGLLEELGYQRYKSSDDMVSDTVAARIRQAARQGITARPVLEHPRPAQPARPPMPDGVGDAPDLMARLVPGVVKGQRSQRRAPSAPPAAPSAPEPPPRAVVERVVDTGALDSARAELAEVRAALDGARAESEQLRAEIAALTEARDFDGSVLDLLEERGLRGLDEAERAIATLAGSHALGRLLRSLRPTDPAALRRLLADQLVLVGGPVPEGLEVPAVTVSDDRADIPSAERLARLTARVGEQLMLCGFRRALLVNVQPRWQPVVRAGLDRRLEITFRPGGLRDAARATEEAQDVDVVLLWNTPLADDVTEAYRAARAHVLQVQAADLGSFLERVVAALAME